MIAAGLISIVAGIITFITSEIKYEEIASSLSGYGRYVYNSRLDNAEVGIYVGIILFLVGVIALIWGLIKKGSPKINNKNLLNTRLCLKCNRICKAEEQFCPNCGNALMKQNKASKDNE